MTPLGPGSHVGPYEVTALLGEGGMGTVWRARHLLLKRDDALKVLPEGLAADPARLARFRSEAELLAMLNHPHIAQVHGVEDAGGSSALVMELVEGPTLDERLALGPLSVEEALSVAGQIAQALDAAHALGIVHRDLKPSNIKVRADGAVKVLDFGLARVVKPASTTAGAGATASLTADGTVVGTPAYMSPEQATGDAGDARSDVWAFGCVLFEMLAGTRAFNGTTAAETLGAVLSTTPDWSRLPAALPMPIRVLLRRCLSRDVRLRPGMSAARLVIEEHEQFSSGGASGGRSQRSRTGATIGMAALSALVAATTAWWLLQPSPPAIVRTTIAADLYYSGTDRDFAFVPGGRSLAYVSRDGTQILIRSMDVLDPVPIFTTAAAIRGPFPSHDGAWIGFVENAFTLKKVPIAGGPALGIVQLDGPSRGAAWGPDDTIVFATAAPATGLQQVSARGGPVRVLTRPDPSKGEADHLAPSWLPGGRALLFTATSTSGGLTAANVAVYDLSTGARRTVIEGGHGARYVGTGHLLYRAADALWAVPFDLSRLETRGRPVQVLPRVAAGVLGGTAHFDVSPDGTLVYPDGGWTEGYQWSPVWVDRSGRETLLDVPAANMGHPRLSPDGRRLAVRVGGDILLWEHDRPWATATVITASPAQDWFPVWSPDGTRLVFGSWRGGEFSNLYFQHADSTQAERLTVSGDMQMPTAISPDGSTVVFHSVNRALEALSLDAPEGPERHRVLIETPREERNGDVSPDGRWLAYEAESSPGLVDVYVRPFPQVDGAVWRVSFGGGTYPVWGRRTGELFYVKPDRTVVAVPVEAVENAWRTGTPVELFRGPYLYREDFSLGRNYDVSPDGQRFLMLKSAGAPGGTHLVAVQNWTTELEDDP